ncbi:hypothetical protein K435DRAFT_798550 [Dendrothele bispora CBS 962.96]|uniref:Uncharacterized protein n=1 Tax=Dendrothele bispora (strain CBS 962.96) TaxID=1314807 RepID=A0A4S8LYY6_DENBC|nr:hypothetical protein K435DRAFT_798550 [Dendrothele bispora CBS 962.96]
MPVLSMEELLNPEPGLSSSNCVSVQFGVKINRQTTLDQLYRYSRQTTFLEYPETSATEGVFIGHLIKMDTRDWSNLASHIAYSLGAPRGRISQMCSVLTDETGRSVQCMKTTSTCQGVKVCPYIPSTYKSSTHTTANREALKMQMDHQRNQSLSDPTRDVFEKTLAYWGSIRDKGCMARMQEDTQRTEAEKVEWDIIHRSPSKAKRGQISRVTCQGRIQISLKIYCSFQHRSQVDGRMLMTELETLACSSKFHIYEPIPEERQNCPWALIVCSGAHTHPIPIPSKTPSNLRKEILDLLHSFGYQLAGLTPRRLFRHPLTHSFLRQKIPALQSQDPTLTDLHPSLASSDHIKAYILQAQQQVFPEGTGWTGLQSLKNIQDSSLPVEQHYIRVMEEIRLSDSLDTGSEEGTDPVFAPTTSTSFRLVIFMTKTQSQKLSTVPYVQSDISFKRVANFMEFELLGRKDGRCLGAVKQRDWGFFFVNWQEPYLTEQTSMSNTSLFITWTHMITFIGWQDFVLLMFTETLISVEYQKRLGHDKVRSKFALQAMCWQKSKVPLNAWLAGDATTNPVESAHRDVYREGIQCSVVEAYLASKNFDFRRFTEEEIFEQTGISTRPGSTPATSIARSRVRKALSQQDQADKWDEKIISQNEKLQEAKKTVALAHERMNNANDPGKFRKRWEKASSDYQKMWLISEEISKSRKGSGKVSIQF